MSGYYLWMRNVQWGYLHLPVVFQNDLTASQSCKKMNNIWFDSSDRNKKCKDVNLQFENWIQCQSKNDEVRKDMYSKCNILNYFLSSSYSFFSSFLHINLILITYFWFWMPYPSHAAQNIPKMTVDCCCVTCLQDPTFCLKQLQRISADTNVGKCHSLLDTKLHDCPIICIECMQKSVTTRKRHTSCQSPSTKLNRYLTETTV